MPDLKWTKKELAAFNQAFNLWFAEIKESLEASAFKAIHIGPIALEPGMPPAPFLAEEHWVEAKGEVAALEKRLYDSALDATKAAYERGKYIEDSMGWAEGVLASFAVMPSLADIANLAHVLWGAEDSIAKSIRIKEGYEISEAQGEEEAEFILELYKWATGTYGVSSLEGLSKEDLDNPRKKPTLFDEVWDSVLGAVRGDQDSIAKLVTYVDKYPGFRTALPGILATIPSIVPDGAKFTQNLIDEWESVKEKQDTPWSIAIEEAKLDMLGRLSPTGEVSVAQRILLDGEFDYETIVRDDPNVAHVLQYFDGPNLGTHISFTEFQDQYTAFVNRRYQTAEGRLMAMDRMGEMWQAYVDAARAAYGRAVDDIKSKQLAIEQQEIDPGFEGLSQVQIEQMFPSEFGFLNTEQWLAGEAIDSLAGAPSVFEEAKIAMEPEEFFRRFGVEMEWARATFPQRGDETQGEYEKRTKDYARGLAATYADKMGITDRVEIDRLYREIYDEVTRLGTVFSTGERLYEAEVEMEGDILAMFDIDEEWAKKAFPKRSDETEAEWRQRTRRYAEVLVDKYKVITGKSASVEELYSEILRMGSSFFVEDIKAAAKPSAEVYATWTNMWLRTTFGVSLEEARKTNPGLVEQAIRVLTSEDSYMPKHLVPRAPGEVSTAYSQVIKREIEELLKSVPVGERATARAIAQAEKLEGLIMSMWREHPGKAPDVTLVESRYREQYNRMLEGGIGADKIEELLGDWKEATLRAGGMELETPARARLVDFREWLRGMDLTALVPSLGRFKVKAQKYIPTVMGMGAPLPRR